MSILPSKCHRYLLERGIAFDEIQNASQRALIFRGFKLPEGKFTAAAADILVLLPPGYPDNPPDMFYTLPWLTLSGPNRYPKAADQPMAFAGQTWQRWSRHNNHWRRGQDGIWTMLKRIETALTQAA